MLFLFFAAIQGVGAEIPAGVIPGGNGGTPSSRQPRTSDTLPKITRRGLPSVYTRRASQIERNNQTAMELTKLIVKELTAAD